MIELDQYNITDSKIHYNTDPEDLYHITISEGLRSLTSDGILSVNTGKFTGRSPKDRYIVKDEKTKNKVWWGDMTHRITGTFCDHLCTITQKLHRQ